MHVFILLSAFEAVVISFLAEWPYHADITEIEDLKAANVKILTSPHFVPEFIFQDPRLQGLIQRTNITHLEDLLKSNQRIGLLTEYRTAQIILKKQINIDRRTDRAYFVMLKEHLSSDLMFFNFGIRNPIRARFGEVQQRVYESGIDQHWISMFTASQSIQQADLMEQIPKMILFEQLQQLKSIFLCLWICSLVVFVIEVISNWISETVSRRIKQRKLAVKQRNMKKKSIKK